MNRNTKRAAAAARKRGEHKLGNVNSSQLRAASKRRRYEAPTLKEHPIAAAREQFLRGRR